jgi:hypothetical protein
MVTEKIYLKENNVKNEHTTNVVQIFRKKTENETAELDFTFCNNFY